MPLPGEPTDSTQHRVGISQGREYKRAFFGEVEKSDCTTTERMRQAIDSLTAAWDGIASNHLRRMEDPSIPEAARLRSSAQFARQRLENSLGVYRSALHAAVEHHGAVIKEINALLVPPASSGRAAIAQEVRATLRQTDEATRNELLQSQNPEVLHAIVSAPAGLSGISTELHDQLKAKFLQIQVPGLVAKAEQLEAGMAEMDKAKRTLIDHTHDLIDFESADAYEELARETA